MPLTQDAMGIDGADRRAVKCVCFEVGVEAWDCKLPSAREAGRTTPDHFRADGADLAGQGLHDLAGCRALRHRSADFRSGARLHLHTAAAQAAAAARAAGQPDAGAGERGRLRLQQFAGVGRRQCAAILQWYQPRGRQGRLRPEDQAAARRRQHPHHGRRRQDHLRQLH
jgi:hypothetical protein